MRDMNSLIFEIIQVALGTRPYLSRTPSEAEWGEMYKMAKKQSLVGICFAGVQKLYNDNDSHSNHSNSSNLSELQYLTWMGMAAKIQQRNETVDQQCKELWNVLHEAGLDVAVMKGQAIGCYYGELSQLRQSGDIDVWVKGGFDTVNEYIQRTMPSDDIAYHRFHYMCIAIQKLSCTIGLHLCEICLITRNCKNGAMGCALMSL